MGGPLGFRRKGETVADGVVEGIQIAPGFSGAAAIRFTMLRRFNNTERKLYLVLTSELEGKEVFTENSIFLTVTNTESNVDFQLKENP